MDNKSNYKYLLSDLSALKGVGKKTADLLKKKKVKLRQRINENEQNDEKHAQLEH